MFEISTGNYDMITKGKNRMEKTLNYSIVSAFKNIFINDKKVSKHMFIMPRKLFQMTKF